MVHSRMPAEEELTWGRSTVETACPLDCPDTCSLAVSLERGRITKIDHSPRHPGTNGFICSKVRRFDRRIYGEERLHYPGSRRGAKGEARFNQITWDQALETIAGRMRAIRKEFGAEAILPVSYGGSNGLLSQDTNDARLFRAFGTSRLARNVCAAPTTTVADALYGRMPGVAYEDYRHARLIVIWGANPSTSGFHLVPHVRAAARDGAAVVVIDPRRTPLARQADIHLAVRPGTDVVVALAIHRFLFEHGFADERFLAARTRHADELRGRAAEWTFERAAAVAEVDPDLLEKVAELYAETSPAVIRCGWGLERNRNGGNAALAVLALPAVGGKFGVRGGGYSMSSSRAMPLSEEDWIETGEPDTRLVNMNHLGRALTEYDDPPGQDALRLQLQPAGHPAGAEPGAGRPAARRPVHGGVRPGDDRHGPLGRRGPAGHDFPGALRPGAQLRARRRAARAARHRARRRVAAERRGVRGARGAARHRHRRPSADGYGHADARGRRPAGSRRRRSSCAAG